MEDLVLMMDELANGHKHIRGRVQTYEQAIGDLTGASKLEHARESLAPERLENLGQKATQLESDLRLIASALEHHFYREEDALVKAFEQHRLAKLASLLRALLREHAAMRRQLADMKSHAAEMATGHTARKVWDAEALTMRAIIANMGKELEAHALREETLFQDVRKALREQKD